MCCSIGARCNFTLVKCFAQFIKNSIRLCMSVSVTEIRTHNGHDIDYMRKVTLKSTKTLLTVYFSDCGPSNRQMDSSIKNIVLQ